MNGFTKLFSSIITSSIWSEDDKTRILWITMLASADANGHVSGSIPGIAALARMSLEDAERSIKSLCSPDQYSRSKKYEGRRLIEVDDGWLVVNYVKYRQKQNPEERKEQCRRAQEKFRRKQKIIKSNQEVINGNQQSAQAEADVEAEAKQKKPRNSDEFRLASLLFSEIRKRKPDFRKPDLQGWAKHIDKMLKLDNREPGRVEEVIVWCQADSGDDDGKWKGWRDNILSTRTLREKFDKLELAMGKSSGNSGGTAKLVRDAEGFTPRERELERIREEGKREKLLAEIEEATGS